METYCSGSVSPFSATQCCFFCEYMSWLELCIYWTCTLFPCFFCQLYSPKRVLVTVLLLSTIFARVSALGDLLHVTHRLETFCEKLRVCVKNAIISDPGFWIVTLNLGNSDPNSAPNIWIFGNLGEYWVKFESNFGSNFRLAQNFGSNSRFFCIFPKFSRIFGRIFRNFPEFFKFFPNFALIIFQKSAKVNVFFAKKGKIVTQIVTRHP